MAPVEVDKDYYMVLEVNETATTEVITKSYKRLALLLHPDRNKKANATEAFQLLGTAYETLKDDNKRRVYNLIYYARIKKKASHSQPKSTEPTSRSAPSGSNTRGYNVNPEAAQISAIIIAKQQRATEWLRVQKQYSDIMSAIKEEAQKIHDGINLLVEIDKAEDAEDAAAKSWTTWLLSSIYQKRVRTEEEKATRASERLQRLHNRSFKEMDLKKKESKLKEYEDILRIRREEFDRANKKDDNVKAQLEEKIRIREKREKEKKERVEAEVRAEAWKKYWEQREKEAAEQRKKDEERRQQQEKEAAQRRMREQEERRKKAEAAERAWKKMEETLEEEMRKARSAGFGKTQGAKEQEICDHDGWWNKVSGRLACEKCFAAHYGYLLQCPGCQMKACATCQAALRPRRHNYRKKFDRRPKEEWAKSPSPEPQSYTSYYEYDPSCI
ncbi:DnaJ domain-containing protein [Xylogone sp. PMI_703]|nr:DnaJ domain-containing protein [Xylogone sp. PMI_703]